MRTTVIGNNLQEYSLSNVGKWSFEITSSCLLLVYQLVTLSFITNQDLGGQDALRSTWKTYYVKTKAVIMVIDSTDKNRLHISRNELHTMLEDEVSVSCALVGETFDQDDGEGEM